MHELPAPENDFIVTSANMIDCTKITEIANAKLVGTDLFVVDCTCSPANEVELLIDSDTSVGIETCVELSRAIEAEFDRDTEDFSLTVASAGIGSELKHLRQYRKLIGKPVEVLLKSGVKILATLDEADQEGLTLSYEEKQAVEGKKRKQTVRVTRRYPSQRSNTRRNTSISNSGNSKINKIKNQWIILILSAISQSSRSLKTSTRPR